ncbi:MAG: MurR/RpiR family transcriptional regulator [Streptococcaceae bacterium]|jgi:DNA-binding MurR/RpiR family transcriptional regulator|nr:MurR/RpiR family transcriptional regulator [Streptococcaceae bacterium]
MVDVDIRLEIKQKYEMLNNNQKRIADVFLNDTNVLTLPIAEIGKLSHTSASAVTRFVRLFNFDSLESFRIALAQTSNTSKRGDIDPIIKSGDSLPEINEKVAALLMMTVSDTAALLNLECVQKAVDCIKKSRIIYLFGIGASGIAAYDLAHKFNRAGFLAIHHWDAHMTIEGLNYIGPEDVLLVFSYSGETKDAIHALQIAHKKKAKVFLISKNQNDNLKKMTDEIIVVPNREHLLRIGAISSLESSMQIGTVIYLACIENMIGKELTERMTETAALINEIKK